MVMYVDTSAAIKVIVEEPESAALVEALAGAAESGDLLLSSWLLHTELHCAASRHPDAVSKASVTSALSAIALVDLTRADLVTAGGLGGGLRSHDAIHLAVAIRVGADAMVTYDRELAEAAIAAGMTLLQPA
jgi:predicted nucleic acid-binding protein